MNSLRAFSLSGELAVPVRAPRPARAATAIGSSPGKRSTVSMSSPRPIGDRFDGEVGIRHGHGSVGQSRRRRWPTGGPRSTGSGGSGRRQLGPIASDFARASAGPEEPAGEPAGRQVGPDQGLGAAEVFEDPLGGEVAAPDGPLHRGGPAGRGPVAGQEQALDRASAAGAGSRRPRAGRRRSPRARSRPTSGSASPPAPRARSRPGRPGRRRGSRPCRAAARSYAGADDDLQVLAAARPAADRPWIAVWLKTHWTSRPTVTTWSNGQTGRSNQRWTPVIGEASNRSSPPSAGIRSASGLGQEPGDPVERDGQDDEVGGDRPRPTGARTPADGPSSSTSTDRTPVVEPDLDPVLGQPALRAGSRRARPAGRGGSPSGSRRGCGGSRRGRPCGRGRRPSGRAARSGPRPGRSPSSARSSGRSGRGAGASRRTARRAGRRGSIARQARP